MTPASLPSPGGRARSLGPTLAALVLAGLSAATPAGARDAGMRTEPLDIVTQGGVRHFTVEIADDPASREKGLMFRKHLAANRGMLFDFKVAQPVEFWMKNTLIPLDMVFIAPDGRVVSVAREAKPMDETPIPSNGDVLGVLEIAGGRAAEIGVRPGDQVRERIFHP